MFLASRRSSGKVRVLQRGGDLLLVEVGAVVAVDQQRHAAAAVDMARPAERVIQRGEFLEQELILLQRRNRLGAARADIHTIAHGFCSSVQNTKGAPAAAAEAPRAHFPYSAEMGRWYGA